ncbi:SCP1-like small phosphatase 4 [Actinidia rufa]|uniref:Mitochondrial import inner membrane translocase subunit TIM50 n=1 Tax=Actinidia rufa TaxID=165716 RepID=A0A7J0ESU3_9ERIC|nr:SCP1-like small phosphatase 4 [Actinidia rufa]
MPSSKMKTKSTTSCVREKHGLRICQKSSMICKNSCSRVRISQAAADFDACIHIGQDGNNEYFEVQLSGAGINKDLEAPLLGADDSDDNSRSLCEYQTCDVSDFHFSDMIVPGSDDNSRSSYEYQTCNVSDCRISDMFIADLPIESNSVCEDISDTACLPDYECDQSSMLFDLAEECMILPFLEDTMQASSNHDDRTCEDIIIDSDDSSLYLAIHQLRSYNQESDANPYLDSDLSECFDPHMFIRNLPELPDAAENLPPTVLPKEMQKQKSITLVLDLDETLVHSTLEHCDDADFTFPVFFNMKEHTVLQVNNGIPIKSWFDDSSDCALISLLPFLETLVGADDVRPIIAKRFGNKE